MAKNFLDKTGLAHFWSKISSKIAEVKTLANNSIKSLSVSGKVITYTKNDGSTGTITTQDTNTVTTATTTGSGNAVTSVTASNGALTVTKGATFLTAHPTISKSTDTTSATTVSHGGVITMVDSVARDTNGHVTKINTKTVTLPSDTNTDTKVTNTLAPITKAYVTGTTSATTNTGTQVFDTGVYLDTTAGKLTATTFNGSLSGNANSSTKLQYRSLASTSTTSSGYYHIYTIEATRAYSGSVMLVGITDIENHFSGIFSLKVRNSSTATTVGTQKIEWISSTANAPVLFITYEVNDTSITYRVYITIPGTYRQYILSTIQKYATATATIITEENVIVTDIEGTLGCETSGVMSDRLATARNLQTNLSSTAPASFNGTANANIGVTGTLPVANGGTGATTFTSGTALIGNGTGAITTRAITNNTTKGTLDYSSANGTNLITLNTLAYWDGSYTGTSSNLAYCNKGAFGSIVTKDTSVANCGKAGMVTGWVNVSDISKTTTSSSTTTTTTSSKKYFKKYTGTSCSIVEALNSLGEKSSYQYRSQIAKANSITLYIGSSSQNTKMLTLLKQGKLIKP